MTDRAPNRAPVCPASLSDSRYTAARPGHTPVPARYLNHRRALNKDHVVKTSEFSSHIAINLDAASAIHKPPVNPPVGSHQHLPEVKMAHPIRRRAEQNPQLCRPKTRPANPLTLSSETLLMSGGTQSRWTRSLRPPQSERKNKMRRSYVTRLPRWSKSWRINDQIHRFKAIAHDIGTLLEPQFFSARCAD